MRFQICAVLKIELDFVEFLHQRDKIVIKSCSCGSWVDESRHVCTTI